MNIIEKIIPDQNSGWESNTKEVREKDDILSAKALYNTAKKRLLQINNWHHLDEDMPAEFQLIDKDGNKISGEAYKGCFFKITTPGPSSESGDGYDWVQVRQADEMIFDNEEVIFIIVHPSSNPNNKTEETAHFFSPGASSCFVVHRKDKTITAAVYGRNEKPNIETESLGDKVRNIITAVGAFVGFAKLQWKSLVEGLMKE